MKIGTSSWESMKSQGIPSPASREDTSRTSSKWGNPSTSLENISEKIAQLVLTKKRCCCRCARSLIDYVGRSITSAIPGFEVRLHLFGSQAWGMAMYGDDFDLGLELVRRNPDEPVPEDPLAMVTQWLLADDDETNFSVEPILNARVPVVKISNTAQALHCDLSMRKDQSCRMAELVVQFAAMDQRVAMLMMFVKYWSKQRQINDGPLGKFTSFGFALLCLKWLQHSKVIPVLLVEEWRSSNKDNLGMLLLGFFQFWASFDFEWLEVSIRSSVVHVKDPNQFETTNEEQTTVVLVDPFLNSNNVGRNIRWDTLRQLRNECSRGALCVEQNRFEELLEKRDLDSSEYSFTVNTIVSVPTPSFRACDCARIPPTIFHYEAVDVEEEVSVCSPPSSPSLDPTL